MRINNKWQVSAWLLIVSLLTVSSVGTTFILLEWNVRIAQRPIGKDALKNESLSRYPFTFPRELTVAHIQKDAYAEPDLVVGHVIKQYLQTMRPTGTPRYRTDTVLNIEFAKRSLTAADQEIIETLNAELNANPSEERRRAIEVELKRIHEETTNRAGTNQTTMYQ